MQKDEPAPSFDPSTCNCFAIRQASRQVTQFYDRFMAMTGLKTSQYSILAKLKRLGPQSINELAALMGMDRTTTGRAVRPLARDRLVRIAAGADGRTRLVHLTPAGEKRVGAASETWRVAQDAFEHAFGPAEAAQLRAALARVPA